MASHRPKRKSGTKTFLDDVTENVRAELPPLKKTRRSSPSRRAVDLTAKTQTRMTRSSIVENDGNVAGSDSIFSKGPSKAKKAKRNQKEQGERHKEETSVPQEITTALRSSGAPRGGSPSRPRRIRGELRQESAPEPAGVPLIRNMENERPPTKQMNTRQSSTGRKIRAHDFETPGKEPSRFRRSPRLKSTGLEVSGEEGVASDKPLTVPLAAVEDTPLVRKRNKEMREAKGHRRSSLGLRGRRASSLSNGFIAAPHPDVRSGDFYKHLDPQMIEIQRMQQLLAWCSKCALSEKRARGRDAQSNARAAARVIEEDILADLTEKKLNINWWEVGEESENVANASKKPNPKNEDHKRKIATLERQLEELNRERETWSDISQRVPAKISRTQRGLRPGELDTHLLRPEEASIIPGFGDSHKSIEQIEEVMSNGRSMMEFKVDQFSHGIHKAQQYSRYAKGVSETILAKASSVLEMRQEAARKVAGTTDLPLHEVLKSISHLDRD